MTRFGKFAVFLILTIFLFLNVGTMRNRIANIIMHNCTTKYVFHQQALHYSHVFTYIGCHRLIIFFLLEYSYDPDNNSCWVKNKVSQ